MVRLTMTEAIVAAIHHCEKEQVVGALEVKDGEPELTSPEVGKPISHGQVLELSRCLREHFSTSLKSKENVQESIRPVFELAELLRGSHVYAEPPKPKPEPTSEYKALMARLRREEEERAYDRMINPSDYRMANGASIGSFEPQEDDEVTYSEINRQVGAIFNVLLSIVACSAAVWMAARHWSTPWRLALSMSGGGIVGLAEVVIYSGYLRRVSEAKQQEKKKVERKQVVDTWTTKEPSKESMVTLEPKADGTTLKRRHPPLGS